jgi:steroid 5-alpha reductase family enzyme
MVEVVVSVAWVIFIYMTVWFILAAISKRNDVADMAWGLGFIVVVYYLYERTLNNSPQFSLILLLTTLWGVRLSTHIYRRFIKKSEDSRYAEMKKNWGAWYYPRTYLQVFILQGCLMLFISMSAIITSQTTHISLNFLNVIGVTVWLIGFFFETLGDLQLTQFLANPINKGKLMTSGLWSLTRHPNYFGEVSQWWGIFLIAVTQPLGLIAIISPLTISYMILKVSGIPLIERKYIGRKDFEEYKKKTSAFFPLFPKRT